MRNAPHFSPWPTPASNGVNLFAQDLLDGGLNMLNPYVYPPVFLSDLEVLARYFERRLVERILDPSVTYIIARD